VRQTVVVVGGGIAGLVSATLLARQGASVHLFEQGATAGGKMNRLQFDGCTFDTGPSLVTMPFVLDDFFQASGSSLEAEVDLISVDPACHYRWSDGSTLTLPNSVDGVCDAISAINPHDGRSARRYLAHARDVYEATKDVFIFSPFKGFKEFLRPRNLGMLPMLPRMRFTSTLHDLHCEYFKDRRIVQLFDRFATYNGSSPYRAPATLMVIPWVEIGYGAFYPKGGLYTIAEALIRRATTNGVNIHLNTAVRRITTKSSTVTGVELADGTHVVADHVISNVDVTVTEDLLGNHGRRTPDDPSCSGFVISASVNATNFGLAHHNVLFSDDYHTEFSHIMDVQRPAAKPTIYIARSCATDSSQSVAGRENWFVLVNAPATGTMKGERMWDTIRDKYTSTILTAMERYGVQPTVREMHVRTPDDMARDWGAWGGSLYGPSSNSMFAAFLRQQQRSKRFTNLWYVGGSAHPGGGIPLVTVSGMLAARLIGAQL
jgi:phytoene desaturase